MFLIKIKLFYLILTFIGIIVITGCNKNSSVNSTSEDEFDVYVAGSEKNAQDIKVAYYWKNGIKTPLTDGLRNACAVSINISGNDIYAAGIYNV